MQLIRLRNITAAISVFNDCMEEGEEVPAWVNAAIEGFSQVLIRHEIDTMLDACPRCWSARDECCCIPESEQ